MLIPVGIFDDHPDPRVLLLGGGEHQVSAYLAHSIDAIVSPAAVAFGGNVGVALRRIKEEVVEDHFVEVSRDQAHGAFAFGAVGGILIIEGAELAARAARGERDTAGSLDALGLELALDGLKLAVGRHHAVAVRLDIDLVEAQLRRDAGEIVGERRRVREPLRVMDRDVDCRAEVLVSGGMGVLRDRDKPQECQDAE